MDLSITTVPAVEKYLIVVAGEVDISNADMLRSAIDLALEQPCESICLDFSDVAYIDSTGIGVLVGAAHAAADRDRAWSIVGVQPQVLRIVQMLGVDGEINAIA